MIGGAGFAYALARLHARLSERIDGPGWQMLDASLDLGHALELAERSRLARFTRRLTRASGIHMIEEVMRAEFRSDLAEIESWLPQRSRPAIRWFGELPFLRERAFAATGEARPDWFEEPTGPDEAWADPAAAWRREWDARTAPTGHAAELNRTLAPMLERYLGREGGGVPVTQPWEQLERYFLRAFRAGGAGPVVVCSYLGLYVLDTERLRGILTARALFPGGT